MNIDELRSDTPGCASVAHLNNAGASLPPRPVIDAVMEHLTLESTIGGYEAEEQKEADVQHFYDAVARLIGARAVRLLADAGRRAQSRLDVAATESLLGRALALLPDDDPERPSLLSVLRRRALIVLAVPILAGGAAAAFVFSGNRDYESTSKLLFRQTIGTELNAVGVLPNTPDADNLANSNVDIVGSRTVAAATANSLRQQGVDRSTEQVHDDVAVSTKKDSDVVDIVASASSAAGLSGNTAPRRYPPSAVIRARRVFSSSVRRRNRTDPSANTTLNPLEKCPPSFGSGFFGSYSTSSGFVQATASPASTIISVFDTPSAMSAIFLVWDMVPGPSNMR